MNDEHLSRRRFLGLSMAATVPLFLGRTSHLLADEAAGDDRVLVVIQLSGGNDGLSTVVPFGDDAYYKARRTTAIRDPLKLDGHVGLHTNLDKLLPLFKDGKMSIVAGASYPNPDRSHFKATDIWHTADRRGRGVPTGWVGRAIDSCCPTSSDPNLMVNIGSSVPYALRGDKHKPVSFEEPNAYQWRGRPGDKAQFDDLNASQRGESNLDWLHRVAGSARRSSRVLRRAASKYTPKVRYPERNRLAGELRTVASLITGGVKTRVYYVSMGGFDTHVRQKNAHDNLMRQLGDAVAAFHADLVAQGCADRVLMMSFSEFGRRVRENASGGTDHGVAGPMFLFGNPVKGGLHGTHPSLTDLDKGDLKMTVDFRSVYATVLQGWLRTPPAKVLGADYPTLKLLT